MKHCLQHHQLRHVTSVKHRMQNALNHQWQRAVLSNIAEEDRKELVEFITCTAFTRAMNALYFPKNLHEVRACRVKFSAIVFMSTDNLPIPFEFHLAWCHHCITISFKVFKNVE